MSSPKVPLTPPKRFAKEGFTEDLDGVGFATAAQSPLYLRKAEGEASSDREEYVELATTGSGGDHHNRFSLVTTGDVTEVQTLDRNSAKWQERAVRRPSLFGEVGPNKRVVEWKTKIQAALDSNIISFLLLIVTLWALFGDDIRLVATEESADQPFEIVTIVVLCVFTIELVLASFIQDDYFGGFYFILDLIATVSLLFDIPAVFEGISGQAQSSNENPLSGEGSGASGSAKIINSAGQSSRAATRSVRLIRLVRILKLYKQYLMHLAKKAQQVSKTDAGEQDNIDTSNEEDDDEYTPHSKVGQKLSDHTTRRVIIGVLLMLFCLQLFDTDTYLTPTSLIDGGMKIVMDTHYACAEQGVSSMQCGEFMQVLNRYKGLQDSNEPMYWFQIGAEDFSDYLGIKGAEHRKLRTIEFTLTQYENGFAFFDLTHESRWQAILNLFKTVFVCLVLGFGAMMFNRDANILVLGPLERIFARVKEMSENPLSAAKKKKEEEDDGGESMETVILENAFNKICSLMAVGYGEAGSEIIAENMKSGGNSLDPMVPGRKIVAIFGFCDIRQFTDTTEILEEGVMEFVNSIAQIVHMEVALHGGSANKNIGDAFLLVWKFPPEVTTMNVTDTVRAGVLDGPNYRKITSVADKALATFVVINAMFKKSERLRSYGKIQSLNDRMPNFSVKMGYGLHVGWAIEGAIGSKYKVDASYLSPNVNMAARLEAATKQFGCMILLSEHFVHCLSNRTKQRVRQIDKVTVKGSNVPMGLFTFDIDLDYQVDVNEKTYQMSPDYFTHSKNVYEDEFEEHPDVVDVTGSTVEYREQFSAGFIAYSQGDWDTARKLLQECRNRTTPRGKKVFDGPTDSLLHVMEEHGFKAPPNWRGYRELTEK
mmetsp:Transcript_38360/g.46273  ORF Transcript_38360/g.46273 Transcript_38360/m.46273 type:complete len:879 (+) Transcript_38360:388-3024(+)